MAKPWRLPQVLAAAFAFGLLAAWLKGPNGGIDSVATLRTDLGNLSAPWLLVGFLAGASATQARRGAGVGLLATLTALLGFYLMTSLVVDLGGANWLDDLWRELRANRIYLAAGLVTGPLLGALGGYWRMSRSTGVLPVVGALLIAEPILTLTLGLSATTLGGSLSLPVLGNVAGWGLTPGGSEDAASYAVYLFEMAIGLAVLLLALGSARRVRPSDDLP